MSLNKWFLVWQYDWIVRTLHPGGSEGEGFISLAPLSRNGLKSSCKEYGVSTCNHQIFHSIHPKRSIPRCSRRIVDCPGQENSWHVCQCGTLRELKAPSQRTCEIAISGSWGSGHMVHEIESRERKIYDSQNTWKYLTTLYLVILIPSDIFREVIWLAIRHGLPWWTILIMKPKN